MSIRHFVLLGGIALAMMASCRSGNNGGNGDEDSATDTALTGNMAIADAYYRTIFAPGEEGLIRAVHLDLPQDSVRSIEAQYGLMLNDDKDGYLQYETDLETDTTGGIDYAEVKYIFDDADRLDIVTINYYIQDSSVTNALFNHLNSNFIASYGDYYIDSDGYTVWESSYLRADSSEVIFDIGIRKYIKLNYPGLTIEVMRFGTM